MSPSARRVAGVALLLFGAIAGIASRALWAAPGTAAQASPCEIEAGRLVSPSQPELGGEVTITTTVRTRCGDTERPLHLVLLVDASQEMAGGRLEEARRALEMALRRLDLGARSDIRVGVVSFAEEPVRYSPLNNDVDRIAADLNNIELGGDGRLEKGIAEALLALRAARPGDEAPVPREVVLLVSSGDRSRCEDVRDQARNLLENQGIVLTTACRGSRCLIGCLPTALERYVYQLPSWEAVFDPLNDLFASRGPFLPIRRVVLHDSLAPQLRYARGGDPTGGAGNTLTWTIERWPSDGMTVTYHAEVLACGTFPSALPGESFVEVEYNAPIFPNTRERFPLTDTSLTVPCAPATPTSPRPRTPTITATVPMTPSVTPTRNGSPTPTAVGGTATPTVPAVGRAWLPLLPSGGCLVEHATVDMVVVADVSGSMATADVPGFENRWALAREVVLATIYGGSGAQGLRPGIDRIGMIAFGGSEARLVALPLAPCCDPARREQIEAFWKIDGSDFARALSKANTLFSDAAPRTASRQLVLVTDGDLDATTPAALAEALAALDQAGVTRHVIGVGSQADRAVLAAMAGSPRRAHRSVDHPASALPRALADLARCLR